MRLQPRSVLGRFFLQTLVWLPITFFIWYQASGLLTLPATWLTEWVLNLIHPGAVEGVEGIGRNTVLATGFSVPGIDPQGNRAMGQLLLPLNPLIYSWNLPVLLALLFAADERFFSFTKLLIGYLLLIPVHVWGLTFDALRTLALRAGPEVGAQLGFQQWQLELIALGYQFGYLMLPVISVATLWILLNLRLIESLLERDRVVA